jgi:cephalosporin-C deacetylase-like acetyl esterase
VPGLNLTDPTVVATLDYFDALHFCRLTDAAGVILQGLTDAAAIPVNTLAAFNQLANASARAILVPAAGHAIMSFPAAAAAVGETTGYLGDLTGGAGLCPVRVRSRHGIPDPAGTQSFPYGSSIDFRVSSPVVLGTTQYVCVGWTGCGSVPPAGHSASTGPVTLSAPTSIEWLWETNLVGGGAGADSPFGAAIGVSNGVFTVRVQADHTNGIYAVGEDIVFTVTVLSNGLPTTRGDLEYAVHINGPVVDRGWPGGATFGISGRVAPVAGGVKLVQASNEPSTLWIQIVYRESGSCTELAAFLGVAVSPSAIGLHHSEPPDFEAFWRDQLARLAAVPLNPRVREVPSGTDGVKKWDVTLDCLGTALRPDAPVRGYYSRPADASPSRKYPAALLLQAAGVGDPQDWFGVGASRCLVLHLCTHSIDLGREASYYAALGAGDLDAYFAQGNTNRTTYYFLGHYLRMIRSLDYLCAQPEWDGHNLYVMGSSQGGGSALSCAGLSTWTDHIVTQVSALVPALCGLTASFETNRCSSWPRTDMPLDHPLVREAIAYFDASFFCRRAVAAGRVQIGLADPVAVPINALAACNAMRNPGLRAALVPAMGHQSTGTPQGAGASECYIGYIENLLATDGGCPVSVRSAHGTPEPAGVRSYPSGTGLVCTVSSPECAGQTQYVCTGWSGRGSAPASGTTADTGRFVLEVPSSIEWRWRTNLWLEIGGSGGGSVDRGSGWFERGATVSCRALPSAEVVFVSWDGDIGGCALAGRQIAVPIDRPRSIVAVFAPAPRLPSSVLCALGPFTSNGYLQVVYDAGGSEVHWLRAGGWPYNATNGETRAAAGDVDGDGRDEIVVAYGAHGARTNVVHVFDDAAGGVALLAELAVDTSESGPPRGTQVACGNVDADEADEIVIGLSSPAGGHRVGVLDDAASGFRPLKYARVETPTGRVADETFVAAGDVDGDGRDEVVVGFGAGGSGQIRILDDALTDFAPVGWVRAVAHPGYIAANGATRVACGDLDGDGRDEIAVGIGAYTNDSTLAGMVRVVDDAHAGFRILRQIQMGWPKYRALNGETRTACGDLDGDGRDEVAVGYGRGGLGAIDMLDDAAAGYARLPRRFVDWPDYSLAQGETRPAFWRVGRETPVITGWTTGFPADPVPPLTAEFSCAAFDPGGTIRGFQYDFGDGSPWFASTSACVLHTYADYGVYRARCVVEDGDSNATTSGPATVVWAGPIACSVAPAGNEMARIEILTPVHAAGHWTSAVTLSVSGTNALSAQDVARLACGDLDGDGCNEFVIGAPPRTPSSGFVRILDDEARFYAERPRVAVGWPAYNAASGETRPACGDLDGDGLDEIVVGFGPGARAFVRILDDARAGHALLRTLQVRGGAYETANGETYAACGDLDGDGRDELVVGFGAYPAGGGIVSAYDDARSGFAALGWYRIAWWTYNQAGGATRVACADLDGDSCAEVVVGFASGGGGRIAVLRGMRQPGAGVSVTWISAGWAAYNAQDGQTWVGAGDVDVDGAGEIVIGYGPSGGGRVLIVDDAGAGFSPLSELRCATPGGAVRPVVMRR